MPSSTGERDPRLGRLAWPATQTRATGSFLPMHDLPHAPNRSLQNNNVFVLRWRCCRFSSLGDHPLFPRVLEFAAAHSGAPRALACRQAWSPTAFVAHCEQSESLNGARARGEGEGSSPPAQRGGRGERAGSAGSAQPRPPGMATRSGGGSGGGSGGAIPFCEAVQQREWELLFDYCAALDLVEREVGRGRGLYSV